MSKILIIDDDTSNLKVLAEEFREQHDVIIAKSGNVGLELAIDQEPDLILLDIIMSGMDGFEVIEKLKQTHNTKEIPVIFITGLDSVDNEEYGLRLGAADYIYKPFHLPVVSARVNTQLKLVNLQRELAELKATATC